MKKILLLVATALVVAAVCVFAQTNTVYPGQFTTLWDVAGVAIPGSSTLVYSGTTALDAMVVSNTSGGSITVTVTDNSTNCNSGVCQILPAVSIAANTTYTIALYGVRASGGVKWSATGTNAAHGWIRGRA